MEPTTESDDTHRKSHDHRHRDRGRDREREREQGRERDRERERERERDKDRKHRHHDKNDEQHQDGDKHKKHKSPSSSSSKSKHHAHNEKKDRDRHSHPRHKSSSYSRHDKNKDEPGSNSRKKDSSHRDDIDAPMAEADDDMWVEKEIPGIDPPPLISETTVSSDSLVEKPSSMSIQPTKERENNDKPKRDAWMMDDGGLDFGLMGAPKFSSRELNVQLVTGVHVDEIPVEKPSYTIGDAGSNWRMTKLRRVLETAKEEGVAPEVIGIERYGSIEKFNEAMEERRELDRRAAQKKESRSGRSDNNRDRRDRDRNDRLKSDDRRDIRRDNDDDDHQSRSDSNEHRPSSRSGRLSEFSSAASSPFQRPMDEQERLEKELAKRIRGKEREKDQERRHTPIPSPFATHVSSPIPNHSAEPVLSPDQLNKLRAKAIRAKMLGMPDAEALEKEYEEAQKAITERSSSQPPVEAQRTVVIQTMGRSNESSSPAPLGPGNSKAKDKKKIATHDEQGNRMAYEGEESGLDLHDLVRREKLNLETNMDKELARRITRDATFRDDLDYMDENADKIARTVKKNDSQLKSAAIYDYRKTQSALENCPMCFKDDGRTPPIMPVVSMGSSVYLGLPLYKEFLPGHCMIVPVQHITSTLECDDDAWDEIRNFMKCLIQMNAAEDKAVIFSETVINLQWQKHTVIECIPIPWDAGQAAPGYFKEAILNADEEWSQHKKLIETDAKDPSNGGFRRRLTSKLPYFHVWFGSPDKGYGHVIENADKFEDYFVKEVLASVCEMDALQWSRRNKKRIPVVENPRRIEEFKKSWKAWDWTRSISGK
ncbi:hypothetical protein BX616_001122 [Lobosporangium transversale]|uniref:CwfJ C-terminus 1-domain-containing protein-like protein n=1 Tax=Lobosporangium transversale TaxID=64571 RepID=A0A1Y2G910_9FUNG|nr:CwfJ C-terminus 1-domain-containing protein-like protein [Lobosporangium transversale]KAF9917404.1 hypothetical protein BX616_001122 [Lobosporangium transversale]ORZ01820.1 CwfJ C-terminus 1-domain-containing protein-like protein [Lobosporangium transversale]|eukprot:XP_021876117.1 CwfJ C-terminus 1-domain-containing protein-like protein [Lobosporangium transversale]